MFGLVRRMPGYKLLILVLVPVAVAAGAMLYLRGRTTGYDIEPGERYVVEGATQDAAEALARALPMRKVLLMPLDGDPDGFATGELRAQLARLDGFEVVEKRDLSTLESVARLVDAFVARLAGARDPEEVSAAPAAAAARYAKAQAVIFGKITERQTAGGRTTFGMALRAARADTGSTLLVKAFDRELRRSWTSAAYRSVWIRSRAWWARVVVWLALTALVPLAAAPLARPLLARESNAANAALLGVYTLVDALAGWLLLGAVGGGAVITLVVLGAIAGGAYNYVICDRLAQAVG